MATDKTDIWVYAHWLGMRAPKLIGQLSAQQAKGRKAFGFTYDPTWIQSEEQVLLDPDIGWYTGSQFPVGKNNFGLFLDSMPDRWGRMLMERRAIASAKEAGEPKKLFYDIDFLLGVQDESRMGALRFKLDPEGPFLAKNPLFPIPPTSSLRKLQHAAHMVESEADHESVKKWLEILIAPGSSLGGARPKANVYDEKGQLWIAKFPSKNDLIDKGAWEYLVHQLAVQAKISMAESSIQQIGGKHHTFLTKRFDRQHQERIHFASAMTMTGNNEDTLKEESASYLDLAEFIQFSGGKPEEDLHQLWRRIVFSIAVSNTDDHLRNHGFLLTPQGWRLSPAYDLNPSVDKRGLALNINMHENDLDTELALEVGEYFQLQKKDMDKIMQEIASAVGKWKFIAGEIGISRLEQELMAPAFRH